MTFSLDSELTVDVGREEAAMFSPEGRHGQPAQDSLALHWMDTHEDLDLRPNFLFEEATSIGNSIA